MRESPALDVLDMLHKRGAILSYTDPYVPTLEHLDLKLTSVPIEKVGKDIDCAVICTNHTAFDYSKIPSLFPLVVDTRNALKGTKADNVFLL
jgi:UDP-N-acetyl-D-glucosamine dehydrogenase